MSSKVTPLLEVIACSVADAIEAEKGGANRLEVVRDLKRGGLTPAALELTILAGGGINGDAILEIGRRTHVREFHVGRAARARFEVEGEVQASLVSSLVRHSSTLHALNLILSSQSH